MADSRVFSIRVPVVTIAQCYDILEISGGKIDNLPPSTCIRAVLEALCQQMEGDGQIPNYTDVTAKRRVETITGQHAPSYKLPTRLPVVPPPPQAEEPNGDSIQTEPEPNAIVNDPDVRAAARQRLFDILNPAIQEAREAEEATRFKGVVQYDPSLDRSAPAKPKSTTPPWEVSRLASMDDLFEAAKTCKMCQAIVEDRNELAALAARIVLPNLSDNTLGTPTVQNLIQKTYGYIHEYVQAHIGVAVPICFYDPVTDDVGITVPPEINGAE